MTKDSEEPQSGTTSANFDPPPLPEVDTLNEFLLARGGSGKGAYITPQHYPHFRTRQQAYRFAAWCVVMGETLPPEGVDRSFDEIRDAIRNT